MYAYQLQHSSAAKNALSESDLDLVHATDWSATGEVKEHSTGLEVDCGAVAGGLVSEEDIELGADVTTEKQMGHAVNAVKDCVPVLMAEVRTASHGECSNAEWAMEPVRMSKIPRRGFQK